MKTIEHKGVRLSIMENAGGRIVELSVNGGENILKSDRSLWEKDVPTPSSFNLDFTGYNGHEVWIGPQSEWWKHQNLNEEKAKSTLFWPPDPYISYGRFRIVKTTDNSISLTGEDSPISGLRMEKTYTILDNGKVKIEVKATNIRKEPVSWDLWMLTRTDGNNMTFVPVSSGVDIKVSEPTHDYEGAAPFKMSRGYFTFLTSERDTRYEACTAKAFITPSRPFIASLAGKNLLVIRFEHHDPKTIHAEQAEVEIYNYASGDTTCMMELEYHAPYKTLAPGESMSTSEEWEVMEYEGQTTFDDVAKFLDTIE